MERFKGLEFTAQDKPALSLEPIPTMLERLDLGAEAKNIKVWGNGYGFEYHLPTGHLARIQSWEDTDGTLRLAVLEEKDGTWPSYREPTLIEMVNFLLVAKYAMPDSGRINILRAQVVARLNMQARVTEERARTLRELADNLQ